MFPIHMGFFAAGAAGITYKSYILADSPEGYWRFNDAASPFKDLGVNLDDFAVNAGGTDITEEITGPVVDDGTSKGVLIGTANDTFLANSSWLTYLDTHTSGTVELWFKPNGSETANVQLIYVGDTTDTNTAAYLNYRTSEDVLRWTFRNNTDTLGTAYYNVETTYKVLFSSSNWYHIVLVSHDTGSVQIYINGAEVEVKTVSGTPSGDWFGDLNTTDTFRIFNYKTSGSDNFSSGNMSEFAIWDTKLSAKEIIQHYNKGRNIANYAEDVADSGAIAHWRMDEASGNLTDEISSVVLTAGASGITYSTTGLIARDANDAIDFDGTTAALFYVNNHAAYQLTGDMSLELWAEFDAISQEHQLVTCIGIVGDGTASENELYRFFIDSANKLNVEWEYSTGTDELVTTTSAITVSADTKIHLAFSRDTTNNKVTFYVNGVVEEVVSYTNEASGGSNADFYIGAPTGLGNHLDGTIDEVVLYNTIVPEYTFARHVQRETAYDSETVAVTFDNPGAESNMTGWEQDPTNDINIGSTASYSHKSGSRHFQGGTSGGSGDNGRAWSTYIDLVNDYKVEPDMIDSGQCDMQVKYWQHSEFNEDYASCGFRWYDATKTYISQNIQGIQRNSTWTQETFTPDIPVNTRFVRVIIRTYLNVGTWSQGGIDDVTASFLY